MGIDTTVKNEIKGDMTLSERIASYIPIYRGYKERNLCRESDRAIRNEVAKSITEAKTDLREAQRLLSSNPKAMTDIERIRTKVDRFDIMVKKAVNGYSGFHAAVKIEEEELNALMQWDASLVDGIQLLRSKTSELMDAADNDTDPKEAIRSIERTIDSMIDAYNERDTVMKGFEKGE